MTFDHIWSIWQEMPLPNTQRKIYNSQWLYKLFHFEMNKVKKKQQQQQQIFGLMIHFGETIKKRERKKHENNIKNSSMKSTQFVHN